MNIIKHLYPKKSLKRKILDIKDEMKETIKSMSSENISILWYGAYDVNPKHLVFWICVISDAEKKRLNENVSLMKKLRDLLDKYEYPESSKNDVYIGVESQETVDRESNGDWYLHFK